MKGRGWRAISGCGFIWVRSGRGWGDSSVGYRTVSANICQFTWGFVLRQAVLIHPLEHVGLVALFVEEDLGMSMASKWACDGR